MKPLAARQATKSVVYPTIRVPSLPGKLLMGVFDDVGEYVDGTVLDRRSGEKGAPIPKDLLPPPTEAAHPEAIYAGPLYYHFGHFLLESLARAWYAQRYPDIPLAWAGAHTWQDAHLRSWQTEILDVLGIRNPTMIVADPTRFELLHIPDIGYRYDDWFHPEHAEFLGRFEGPPQIPGRRLWLSRSKIANDARDFNAPATERHLAAAGWHIAHPETLSVREQLEELSRAEVVAGEEGSALHSLVLLKDVSSKSFRILRRHGHEHRNMHTVGNARAVNQTFHTLKRERVLRAEGRVVSKLTPNASETLDLLEVPVPCAQVSQPEAPELSVLGRALENLAPKRLLEVGAAGSELLVAATAATRVGVSSRFDFDPRPYAGSGAVFFELDLAQYAEHFHRKGERFDVIRIAETEFKEVMEAFRASERLAHQGTTWLLGTGEVAARAALAVRLVHPGFTAKRLFVQRTTVFVVRRVPGQPRREKGVGRLSAEDVAKRTRWLPITVARPRRRRIHEAEDRG